MRRIRRRKGLTGLETAIILIAFIITAAAFAFAILNVGFRTTQQAQTVISEGMKEASAAIELSGAVIAEDQDGDGDIDLIRFTIKLSPGMRPVDLSPGKLTISWHDADQYKVNIYTTTDESTVKTNGGAVIVPIEGAADNDYLLELGEKYEVRIYNGSSFGFNLTANDEFTVELKPAMGAVLTIHRVIPPEVDKVNFLGCISIGPLLAVLNRVTWP